MKHTIFCDEQENAIRMVSQLAQGKQNEQLLNQELPLEYVAVRSSDDFFCNEATSRKKTISLESEYLQRRQKRRKKNEE